MPEYRIRKEGKKEENAVFNSRREAKDKNRKSGSLAEEEP